jgi:hypothetical protein
MDFMTILFISLGLLLLLTPLRWINSLLGDTGSGSSPSYLTLVVPGVGIVLLAIGLLAYHKSDIQCIFYKVCRDIDQTGLGMGIGQAGKIFVDSIFGSKPPTPSLTDEIKPVSQI